DTQGQARFRVLPQNSTNSTSNPHPSTFLGTLCMTALLQSEIPGVPCRRGKVRDVYDLGDKLVIVATDRISAFDWILPTPIPDKGRILTAMTRFWFDFLGVPNHLISEDVSALGAAFAPFVDELRG